MAKVVDINYSNISQYTAKISRVNEKLALAKKQLSESTDFDSSVMQAFWNFGSKKYIFGTINSVEKNLKKIQTSNDDLIRCLNNLESMYENISKKTTTENSVLKRFLIASGIIVSPIAPLIAPFVISAGNYLISPPTVIRRWIDIMPDIKPPIAIPKVPKGHYPIKNNMNKCFEKLGGEEFEKQRRETYKKMVENFDKDSIPYAEQPVAPAKEPVIEDYLTDNEFQKLKEALDKFANTQYVWGGASTDGVDCSGLVMTAFKNAGINANLPHSTVDMYKACKPVVDFPTKQPDLSKLRPGDLLFYSDGNTDGIGHVSVYMGDGKVMHALNPKDDVKITNFNYTYKSHIYVARVKNEVRTNG